MSLLAGLGALFGGLAGLGGLAGSIAGGVQANRMTQEQFQWQQDVYAEQIEREDTAVQRRVSDLQAAGLSPVLAAGQGAQANAGIKPVQDTGKNRGAEAAASAMQAVSMITNLLKMKKDFAQSDAQTELIRQKTQEQQIKNQFAEDLYRGKSEQSIADARVKTETANDVISYVNARTQNEITENQQRQQNIKLAELKITGEQIANARATIMQEQDSVKLSNMQLEYAARELAIEEARHNLDIYKEWELPTNVKLPSWLMLGQLGKALGISSNTPSGMFSSIEELQNFFSSKE